MDTLALLCNLYGDGPQTLRRLREAGFGTLAALESLESERLASLLRTSVRSAKRFQSEGRLLRERSDPVPERSTAKPREEAPRSQAAAAPDPLVANVLTAWRERDARPATVVADSTLRTRATTVDGDSASAASVVSLEGLTGADAELLERLSSVGIESPEALCDADILDLAGRGVGGYTRLLHLQFLARRARAVPATPAPAPRAAAQVPAAVAEWTEVPQASRERPDVLVPARPPERRRSGPAAAKPPAKSALRFSPRESPYGGALDALEAELERFAARQTDAPPAGGDTPSIEDAGSSGPFA